MKKKNHNQAFICLFLFVCIAAHGMAQTFQWESKISKPEQEGYYHILIEPRISAKLNEQFSDIRIYDEQGKEVPYIIREEQAFLTKRMLSQYRILSRDSKKGCCTRIVLHNPARSRISNLSLFIRNSDAQKKMRLSGSDDNLEWYVVKENYWFSGVYSDSGTTEIKMLDFPLSNYEYYQLEIDDSSSAPVNVISAGYYTTYSEIGNYTEMPQPVLVQIDSTSVKRSYIKVTFDGAYNFDRLVFSIEGPRHFLRNARLAIPDANGKLPAYGGTEFRLSSNAANQLDIQLRKLKEFYIIIENEDDQPLKIKSVSGFQLTRYLAAWLDKEKQYVLRFGNKESGFPKYDAEYFRDSIPSDIPLAASMEIIKLEKGEDVKAKRTDMDNILIWSAIGVVVFLLGFMTVKMLREMKS